MQTPNAIFVGPEVIGNLLRDKVCPEWNFFPSVPDIRTFRKGLSDETIDSNIQVVILLDKQFDPSGNSTLFEQTIAEFSGYCMLAVVAYAPELQSQIEEQVEYQRHQFSLPSGKVFFVSKSSPRRDITNATDVFTNNPPPTAEEAASIISGKEYIAPDYDSDPEEVEAATLRNQVPAVETNTLGQVVAVTSSKGGSGKSTVSVTLATYLAHASQNSVREGLEADPLKVILLDLDVRDGQVGFITGRMSPNVMHLQKHGIDENTIRETAIPIDNLKIDVMLAPRRPRSAETLPPDFYIELIQNLRTMYDYVIIDTSVNYTDPLLEKVAYPIADQIVMVTEVVQTSVFSMARWVQEVTSPVERMGMGIPKSKIGIVVNKALAQVAITLEEISENAQEVPLITAIPSNQRLIAHATNVNSMETLLDHRDLRKAFKRLAEAIVGDKYALSSTVP